MMTAFLRRGVFGEHSPNCDVPSPFSSPFWRRKYADVKNSKEIACFSWTSNHPHIRRACTVEKELNHMGSKLFVGGLAWATSDESLRVHFSSVRSPKQRLLLIERLGVPEASVL